MADLNNWGANLSGALSGDIVIFDGTQYVRFDPEKHEFYQIDINTGGSNTTSGTGASNNATNVANYYHAENLTTGTTTTGYSGTSFGRLAFPTAAKVIVTFNIETNSNLSDATDEYEYNVGCWVGNIESPTDGYYFKYLRTSNTNWLCSTIASSTETATDSSTSVSASTQYNLRMVYDSTTPDVKFYIDNSLVATNTTNIPTSGNSFVRIICKKSAGTSSRSIKNIGLNVMIIRD